MTSASHRGAGNYRFLRITADGTLDSTEAGTDATLTRAEGGGQQPGSDCERMTNALTGR